MIKIIKRSFAYMRDHRWQITLGVVLALIHTIFGILSSYSLKLLVDDVLLKGQIKWLWPLEFTYMAIVFMGAIFMILSTRLFSLAASKCLLKIKKKMFNHYLKMHYEEATRLSKSDLTNLLTYGVDSLYDAFSSGIPMMISSIISITLILAFMFALDFRLTIISLFVYPLLVFVNSYIQKIISREQDQYMDNRQALLKEIDDAVKCHDEIWTYNLLQEVGEKFLKQAERVEDSRMKLNVIGEFRSQASWVLIMVPYQAILYGIGGMLMIKNGNPSLGVLLSFSNFTNLLIGPVMRLVNISGQLSEAGVGFEKMDKFTALESQGEKIIYSNNTLIKAENLNFKYKYADKETLSGMNFEIDEGKTTVLWGQSGSGKSTLLKIIAGMLASDGIKVRDKLQADDFIRSKNWAYFPQAPNTFDGKVRDLFKNINPRMTDQEMLVLLDQVGMGMYFKNKEGLYTEIKNAEATLSGGEHRRFCLALFLAYGADILLFDEPTASLDKKNREQIIKIISSLKEANKTCLISTHDQDLKEVGDEVIDMGRK